jgi:hypothetical protein
MDCRSYTRLRGHWPKEPPEALHQKACIMQLQADTTWLLRSRKIPENSKSQQPGWHLWQQWADAHLTLWVDIHWVGIPTELRGQHQLLSFFLFYCPVFRLCISPFSFAIRKYLRLGILLKKRGLFRSHLWMLKDQNQVVSSIQLWCQSPGCLTTWQKNAKGNSCEQNPWQDRKPKKLRTQAHSL